MRLFRESRGNTAYTIVESDGKLPQEIIAEMKANPNIRDVVIIQS